MYVYKHIVLSWFFSLYDVDLFMNVLLFFVSTTPLLLLWSPLHYLACFCSCSSLREAFVFHTFEKGCGIIVWVALSVRLPLVIQFFLSWCRGRLHKDRQTDTQIDREIGGRRQIDRLLSSLFCSILLCKWRRLQWSSPCHLKHFFPFLSFFLHLLSSSCFLAWSLLSLVGR